MILTSGNLGLGVTPSAWGSGYTALQIPSGTYGGGSFFSDNGSPAISANAYNNSGWKYVNTDYATIYQSRSGQHQWFNAPSGTAGNAITFTQAMTLTAAGNLGVGVTPTGKLHIALPTYSNEDTDSQQAIFGVASGYGVRIGYSEAGNYGVINSLKPAVAWGNLVLQSGGGNVLIGTTTNAGYKLDVNGTGRFSGDLSVATAGSTAVLFDGTNPSLTLRRNNNGNASAAINFKGSSAVKWQMGTNQAVGLGFEINEGDATANRFYLAPGGAATFYSSVSATSFFEVSDKTQKTLIKDNVIINGIENILAKTYIKDNKEEIGYFAQDLQGVLNSSINIGENGLLSLSYRQVHTAKISSLEFRVKELEKKLMKYEA
jgi:hypothetical protein